MKFMLYYGEEGDPYDTKYIRRFASRQAALEHALLLHRNGYDLYALVGDDGDELSGEQILENACQPTLH